MELLVTLHKKENFDELCKLDISGIIFGSLFAHGFELSLEDMVRINEKCEQLGLKRFVSINSLIGESDLEKLDAYIDLLKGLNVDGIYFSDFAVASKAYEKDIQDKLIYDPYNLNTNIKDISFFNDYNIPCVLARELTLEEITQICRSNPFMIDIQIFGYLRMSESKRKYISNYYRNFNINEDPTNKKDFTIREQSRDYRLPILEDDNGTCVYTDYVFAMFDELKDISKYIKHAIIDDLFIDFSLINEYVRYLPTINEENLPIIKDSLKEKYPNITLSNGYLFQKTTDTKVNDDKD